MADQPVIEIREPGEAVRRVVLDHAIEVGRDCDGEVVSDPGVSRRHVKLVPNPTSLSVVDLGSRNGTLVNGNPLSGRASLQAGDIVRLGAPTSWSSAARWRTAPVIPARATVMARPVEEVPVPKPPPPAPVVEARRRAGNGGTGRLGITTRPGQPVFPNYMEIRRHIPIPVWHAIRVVSVCAYIALCVGLFVRPAGGLFWFFKVVVPLLPITFFVAPGLWRNVCPLAASNQAPRVLGFTRGFTPPQWLRSYGYIVAIVLFFGITSARLAVFNAGARATGILLSLTILNAFAAGLYFKGKSGWCSSICPLLPLQRVYGQTPFVTVPNSHCQPCVACTKNCYDFKPRVAYQADLHDPDPRWSSPRKLFAAALPGFVLGFFTLVAATDLTPAPDLRAAGSLFRRQHRLVLRPGRLVAAQRGHVDCPLRVRGHQYFLLVRQRNVGRLVEDGYRDRHTVGALADKVPRLGAGLVLAGSDPRGGAAVRTGVRPGPPAHPAERQGFAGRCGPIKNKATKKRAQGRPATKWK